MSKTKPTRLQGPEWHSKKDSLLMTKYRINEKGHVKGFYTDIEGNLYSHWFNNEEAKELKEQEKIQEEIHLNNIGKYKVGVRPNGSLSMYHIPDEEEPTAESMSKEYRDTLDAWRAATNAKYGYHGVDKARAYTDAAQFHHINVDQAKGPDYTSISVQIPNMMSDTEIELNIDKVLSRDEYVKQINDLVIEDEKERYVRALLNRISKAITALEEGIEFCKNDSQGVYDKCNMAIKREEKVIAILKGDTNE